MVFNIICIWSIPFLIFATVGWDTRFLKQWKKNEIESWKAVRYSLLLERITLHLPMLVVSLWLCIENFNGFLTGYTTIENGFQAVIYLIFATIIVYTPYLVLDVRFSEKRGWPIGKNLALLAIIPWSLVYLLCIHRFFFV
ncbi:MAG: hypothetical protein GF364_04650 [Candidatus Lokiarchaeota archaeon]|nr:hypothetical protein [Candidatus Lokiarchaeota archaeon]